MRESSVDAKPLKHGTEVVCTRRLLLSEPSLLRDTIPGFEHYHKWQQEREHDHFICAPVRNFVPNELLLMIN